MKNEIERKLDILLTMILILEETSWELKPLL